MNAKRSPESRNKETASNTCPLFPVIETAQRALSELEAGNKRYVRSKDQSRCNLERWTHFKDHQTPWAIILTCADSRVSPELVFDSGVGELFVARVAGNIADSTPIASIEYAVANLNVQLVVVLGHENCGAVKAALGQNAISYNLNLLLGHLAPVADQFADKWNKASKAKKLSIELTASRENTRYVAKQLREQSTILNGNKSLKIVPALYHTSTGKVKFDPKKNWA